MSRGPTGDVVVVKPSVNVYTALAGVAFVAVAAALVLVFLKAQTLFGPGGFLQF